MSKGGDIYKEKKKQTSHLLRLKVFGQYCYVNRLRVTFVVCFKHPSQLGGEIPGEYNCLRAFSHYVQSFQ